LVGPSRVGDPGIGVEPHARFFGAGAYRAGDLVSGMPVEPGVGHHLGQESLGLDLLTEIDRDPIAIFWG
jgi:hypothetical protein